MFTWTAQQQETNIIPQSIKIKIPGTSFEWPLIIGGLPFTIEISTAIILHPALTAKGAFSTGEYSFGYAGSDGWMGTDGNVKGEGHGDETAEINHDTSIFSLGPAAFLAALELPRIEVALGVESPLQTSPAVPAVPGGGYPGISDGDLGLIGGLAPNSPFSQRTFGVPAIAAQTINKFVQLPITPYGFGDLVFAATDITPGVTGTPPLPGAVINPPCQKVNYVVGLNAGFGVKIQKDLHLKKLNEDGLFAGLIPGKISFEGVEISVPLYRWPWTGYKNGVGCP